MIESYNVSFRRNQFAFNCFSTFQIPRPSLPGRANVGLLPLQLRWLS